MAGIIGLLLVIAVPMLLVGEVFQAPSPQARRIVFGFCTGLSATAVVLWLLGLDALPVAAMAYIPAYQLYLLTWVLKQFRSTYGRDMQLIASGIIDDAELKKDAHYSTAYFIAAVGVPMFVVLTAIALNAK